MATDVHQQQNVPGDGADVTLINDEDLLRRMWQSTDDFGRKKEIRGRMYRLREQRLKEFYTTGEVASDILNSPETRRRNRQEDEIVVRQTYKQGVCCGDGGSENIMEISSSSQDSLTDRMRQRSERYQQVIENERNDRRSSEHVENIMETGTASETINKSNGYALHSQSLADEGFLTMKSKEIRDSESPTREFHDGGSRKENEQWYEEKTVQYSGNTGDGDVIVEVTTVKTDDAPEGVTVTRYHTDQKSRLPRMVTSSKQAVSSSYSTSGTGSSTSSRSTNVVSTSSSSSHVRKGTDSDGVVIAEISVRDSSGDKKNQDTVTEETSSSRIQETSAKSRSDESEKKVEVSIMKELQKLDSFLAENAGSTPVSPCATFDTTRDSNWTVVSSKKQNGSSRDTEEFVFTSGAATDNTDYDNSKVITVITRELKDNEPQTVSSGVAKSYSVTKHGRIEVKDGGEPEVVEIVNATESTTKWEGKGDAIEITYQQKRISTDVSPTHETFARSLRSSSAYDSSTRSSSKTSLEDARRCSRGSPERPRSRDSVLTSDTYSKERVSPTRSVKSISSTSTRFSETTRSDRRNLEKDSVRVSPTRSARSSPEKTITRDRTSPTKSPERKIQEVNVRSTSTTKRKLSTTASRSSPKRSATPRASPRASPDRASDRGSPDRRSPNRDTINGYSSSRSPSSSPNRQPTVRDRTSPSRASPQRASPARDSKDGSPVRLSPERKPLNEYPARTSPARTSPDRSAQKTSRRSGSTSPDRKYLNEYPARSSPTKESPTRKSSKPEVKEAPDKRSPERKPLTEYPSQGTTDKTPSDGNTPSYQKPTRSATERKLSTDSIHRKSITKLTGRDSLSKTTTTKSIDKESPMRSSPERSVPMNPRDGIDDDEINVNEVKEHIDIRATISTKKTKRTRDSSSSSSEEEPEAEGVTRIEDHAVSVVAGQTIVREDYDSCYNTTRVVSNETELKRRTDEVSRDLASTEEHRISDTDKLHTVRDDTSVTNRGSVDISSEHVTTSVIMAGRRSHETSPDRVPVGERYPTSPSRDEPTRGDIPVTDDDSEEPIRSSNFKPEISEQDKPQKAPEDRTSKPAAKQPPERKSSLKQPRTSPERRSPINDTRNTEINVTARTSQTKVEVRKDITRKVSDTKLASKQKEEPKRKTSSTKEVPKSSSVSPERPRKQSSGVAPQRTVTKKPVEGKEDEPSTRRPEKKISTLSLKHSPRSSPERQSPRRTTSPSSEKPRNCVSPGRPQERRQSPSQPLKPTIRGHSPSENTTSSRSPSTSPERTRKPTFPSKKQREVNGSSRSPSSSPERAIKPVNAYNKRKNTSESSSSSPDRSRKPSTSPSRSSKPIATQETPRSPSSSPERPRKSLTSLKRPQAPQSSGSSPSTSPERVRKSITGTDKLLNRKPSRHSPERQTGTMQPLEGSSRSPSSSPERRRPSSDTDRKNKQPERPSYLVSRPDKKKPTSDEPGAAKPSPSTTIGKPSNEKPLRTSPARTPRESPRRQLDNTDDEYTDRSLSASSPETVKTLDLAKPVEFDIEFKQVDEDEEDIIVSEERKSSGVYVHEFSKTDTTYTNEDTDDKPVSLSSITTMNFSNKPSITRLTNVNAMLDKKHNVSMELETTDINDYSVTVQDDVETKQPHVIEPKPQTSEEPLKQPKPKTTVTTSRVGLARSKFEKNQQKQTETTVGRRTATHTSKIQSPGYSKIPGRREPESTRGRTDTPTRVTRKPDTQKAPQQRTPSQSSIGRSKATDKQPQKRTPSQSSLGRPKTGDIASPKSRESTPQRIPVKKSPAESSPLSRRPADKPDRYSRTDSNRSLKKDTETRTTVTRVTKQSSRPEMKSPSVRGTVVTQTTRTTRTTPKQPSTTEVTKKPIRGKDDVGKKETVMKPTDITRKVSKTEITLTTLTNTEVNGGLRYSERDDATSSSDESDTPRYYIETDRKSFEGVTIEEIASDDKGIYRDTSDVELTISTEKYDTDSSIDHTVKSRETSPDSMVRHTYKSNINQQFDDVRRYSRDEVVASVDVSENVTSLKTVDTREDEYAVERPERVEEDKPRRFSTEIYVQPAPTAPKLEDDSEDTEPSSLTVADRVTRFTRIPLGKTKVSPKPKAEPEVTDNLDSPSAVKKARSMFETLAKSPSSPKQIDILSRPSIFHARRGLSPSRPQPSYERPTTPKETDDLNDDDIRKISRTSIDRDITSTTTQSSLFASSVETESTRYGEEPEESGRPETPTRPGRKPSQESPRTTSPSRSPKEPETTYHRKPSVESPRHTSPIRCAPKAPKETESPRTSSPTRPDTSYQRKPSIESPRSVSPTRRVESPRHTSPIRCAPKAPKETESPRTSSPTRPDTSQQRKPSVESPRSVSPTRRVSKEAESPVRRPSQESPRTSSPTRSQRKPSQDSPREISPSRAAPNRRPSQESPRTVSPQRTSSSRPVAESPRKPSDESPRLSSPTRTPKEGNWTTRQTPFGPSKVFSNRRPQEEPRRKPSEATPEKTPSPPNKSSTLPRKVSHDKPLSVDENDTPRDTSPARRDKSEPRDTKPTDDVEAKQPSDARRPAPEGRRSSDRTVPTLNRSGSRVEALVNKVEKRATETTTRKTMEESTTSICIEEITDIILLERMLEAAASYDERRRIRTQIRIVRRDGPRTPIRPSPVTTDKIVQPAVKDTKPRSPETPRQETSRKSPTRGPTRSPSRSPTRSPTRVPQPVPVVEPKVSTVDEPEAPTQDAFVRKSSKSELTVELSKAKPASTASPATKAAPVQKKPGSDLPREACPTDSVTSSYGVGPTDENGLPLFGLRALRRKPQNADATKENDVRPQPTAEPERDDTLRDSSGRPLFGLRAITVSGSTKTESTRVERRQEDSPRSPSPGGESPEEVWEEEPEKDIADSPSMIEKTVVLRDLVQKHEQRSRTSFSSQSPSPVQKPRAKLRDSFIFKSQDDTSEQEPSSPLTEDAKIIKERSHSLKAIIQKHESIAYDDEVPGDNRPSRRTNSLDTYKLDSVENSGKSVMALRSAFQTKTKEHISATDNKLQISENIPETDSLASIAAIRRSGLLKPSQDDGMSNSVMKTASVTTETRMTSSRRGNEPEISSVSMKRDVITGETVARSGEEPVTRITRTKYEYNTPENDPAETLTITDVTDLDDSEEKTATRRSSASTKVEVTRSSPERGSNRRSSGLDNRDRSVSPSKTTSETNSKEVSTTTKTASTDSSGFSRVTRGGSVKALSQKFQKAADESANRESFKSRSYPKAGLIFRTSSFKLGKANGECGNCEDDAGSGSKVEKTSVSRTTVSKVDSRTDRNDVRRLSTESKDATRSSELTVSTTSTTVNGTHRKSFLGNDTKVTGVQDIISRMREADNDTREGDNMEDAEARALLNKFLGAQCILQGMDPIMKAQSPALVRQVEQERISLQVSVADGCDQDIENIHDERLLRQLLESSEDYETRRRIRTRIRTIMADQKATVVAGERADGDKTEEVVESSVLQSMQGQSESMSVSASGESSSRTVTRTEVHSKTSSFSSTTTGKTQVSKVPPSKMMSPFAKFKQLDKQASSSAPNSPKTPGGTGPLFKFTDPGLSRSASSVKDGLLYWCQNRTKDYKNIKIENFSTSWSNGLAFCALIHRFCPDAFDYEALRPEERRKNFELAFRVADEKAGIAPLLDVEDMVEMRKPDWKCVFTYVQSIYRRFKDED